MGFRPMKILIDFLDRLYVLHLVRCINGKNGLRANTSPITLTITFLAVRPHRYKIASKSEPDKPCKPLLKRQAPVREKIFTKLKRVI
jgi:hypothetical protein